MFHGVDTGTGEVIGVHEFPERCSIAPAGDCGVTIDFGFMKFPEESREDVGIPQVVIITRSVHISRHDRDELVTELREVGLAQFDSCDLGDGVPLIGGFQVSGKQVFRFHGLGTISGVNAGTSEEKQFFYFG